MASDLYLRLHVDPTTGKRTVVVDYTSDSDALPIEHEDTHKKLAGKVIEGGLKNKGIKVSREGDNSPVAVVGQENPQQQPVAVAGK